MPDEEPDLTETIAENAQGPAAVSGDAGSVTQHSLRDQIEADKYLKQQRIASANGDLRRILKRYKIVPPGTV